MGMNRKTGEDFDVFLSIEHIFIIIRIRMDTESAIVTDYDGRVDYEDSMKTINNHILKEEQYPTQTYEGFETEKSYSAQTSQAYMIWEPEWVFSKHIYEQLLDHNYCSLCPSCGKVIRFCKASLSSQQVYVSQDSVNRYHFIHKLCISVFTEYTLFKRECSVRPMSQNISDRGLILGGGQYLVSMKVCNVLGTKILFRGMNKLVMKKDKSLIWQMRKEKEGVFEANIVCFPVPEFRISIQVKQIRNKKQIKLEGNVDMREGKEEGRYEIKGKGEDMVLEGEMGRIEKEGEKRELVQKMNFKYGYEVDAEYPLFVMQRIRLTLLGKDDYEQGQSQVKVNDDDRKTCYPDSPLIEKRQQILIYKHLKTQVGSKEYQKMIRTMDKEGIDRLIEELDYSIGALIQDEFGNYFVQTLFSICEYDQRAIIIESIRYCICDLVSSQQGTFTLQQFINYMSASQVQGLFHIVEKEVLRLCYDEYGTHFLRKLIKYLPFQQLERIYRNVEVFFMELAFDKRGVCILKQILRATVSHDLKYEFVQRVERSFDELVENEYGNYVIQEIMQKLSKLQTMQLSRLVIKNFKSLCTKKYSSLVIVNCLKRFWRQDRGMIILLSKEVSGKMISSLQKYKQANKVLWQLKAYPQFENWIQGGAKVSKNHSFKRDNKRKGYYSGKVGTEHSSFSSAVEHINKNNYIN